MSKPSEEEKIKDKIDMARIAGHDIKIEKVKYSTVIITSFIITAVLATIIYLIPAGDPIDDPIQVFMISWAIIGYLYYKSEKEDNAKKSTGRSIGKNRK